MESTAIDLPSQENAGHTESDATRVWEQSWEEDKDGHDKEQATCEWADSAYWFFGVFECEWRLDWPVKEADDGNG